MLIFSTILKNAGAGKMQLNTGHVDRAAYRSSSNIVPTFVCYLPSCNHKVGIVNPLFDYVSGIVSINRV